MNCKTILALAAAASATACSPAFAQTIHDTQVTPLNYVLAEPATPLVEKAAVEVYGPPAPIDLLPKTGAPVDPKAERKRIQQKRWNAVKPIAVLSTLTHLADGFTTHECSKAPNCYETNSMYGSKNPSLGTIIAIKAPVIVGGWLLGKEISKQSAFAGYVWFGTQTIITGKLVKQNIKILY